MKSQRFQAGSLLIERTHQREGPPIVYTVCNGKTSRLFTDQKLLLKFVKWPTKTPGGDSLREWLASFDQKAKAPAFTEAVQANQSEQATLA